MNIVFLLQVFWMSQLLLITVISAKKKHHPPPPDIYSWGNSGPPSSPPPSPPPQSSEPDTTFKPSGEYAVTTPSPPTTTTCPPQQPLKCPPNPECPKLPRPPPPPPPQECPKPPPPPPPQECPKAPPPQSCSNPKQPTSTNGTTKKEDVKQSPPPPPPAECPKQQESSSPQCSELGSCEQCTLQHRWPLKYEEQPEESAVTEEMELSDDRESCGGTRRQNGDVNSIDDAGGITFGSYGSYQGGILCNETARFRLKVGDLASTQELVKRVNKIGDYKLKPIGGLYTISDSICTTGIPLDMTSVDHMMYDGATQTVTVGAGATLGTLMRYLARRNRTLSGMPSYGGVTVGGALATGSHGSSLKRPTSLSDQVVSMLVVDGLGNAAEINDTSKDFNALRVNLGLLGIVYQATFKTSEQFKLHVTHTAKEDSILIESFEEIEAMAKGHDHFQVYWLPGKSTVVLSAGNVSSDEEPQPSAQLNIYPEITADAAAAFYNQVEAAQESEDAGYFDRLESYRLERIKNCSLHKSAMPIRFTNYEEITNECLPCTEAIGYSHKMTMDECKECYWSHGAKSVFWDASGFAVTLKQAPAAIKQIYEILRSGGSSGGGASQSSSSSSFFGIDGIWLRFVTGSASLMGVNYGEPVMTVEWKSVQRRDKQRIKFALATYQAISQELMFSFNARPHWSKNGLYYSSIQNIIDKRWKHLDAFRAAMKRLDPNGIFLNNFGERIGGTSNAMSVREDYSKYCAANEVCLCSIDKRASGRNSCGMMTNSSELQNKCEHFSLAFQYAVCKRS